MNARLLPWAAFAALVLTFAVRAALPGKGAGVAAPGVAREAAESGPQIRLGPAEMVEFHEDGAVNRLAAEAALYEFARRTMTAREVVVHLQAGSLRGATVRAPAASWDFDRASMSLPGGCRVDHEGGWTGDLSPATLDLAGRTLRAPGAATFSAPGFIISGNRLVWNWGEGNITLDSPKSRIQPAAASRRKG